MAFIVLICSTICRLCLKSVFSEIFVIIFIICKTCRNIVISAKNAVRHACFVKNTHCFVCIFPLICHIDIIYNIACMNNIFNFTFIRIIYNPVINISKMMLPFLRIILCISFPCKTEIVIFWYICSIPAGIIIFLFVCNCIKFRK